MTAAPKKTVLIVLRHSPYGSGLAKAALDTALATAAFDQAVDLLFIGMVSCNYSQIKTAPH